MMENQHDVPSQRQATLTVGQQKAQEGKATQGKQGAYLFEPLPPLGAMWLGFLLAHSYDISQYYGLIGRYLMGSDDG